VHFFNFVFGSMIPYVFFPTHCAFISRSVPWVKSCYFHGSLSLANYHTSTTAQNHQHNHQTQRITDGERAKETQAFVGHHTFFIINAVFKHVFCLEQCPVVLLCKVSIVLFLEKKILIFPMKLILNHKMPHRKR